MGFLEEDDLVAVFIERGEKLFINTSEKPLKYVKMGDFVTADIDEKLTFPVTLQKQMGGDYKVKVYYLFYNLVSFC